MTEDGDRRKRDRDEGRDKEDRNGKLDIDDKRDLHADRDGRFSGGGPRGDRGMSDRGDRGMDRGSDRGPERGSDRNLDRGPDRGGHPSHLQRGPPPPVRGGGRGGGSFNDGPQGGFRRDDRDMHPQGPRNRGYSSGTITPQDLERIC